jgi:hypothetical protein
MRSRGHRIAQQAVDKALNSAFTGRKDRKEWRLLLVDLGTGKVDAQLPGYLSALGWNDSTVPQFTEDASIVAMDENRAVVLWDLKSGAKRPLPS